MRLPRRHFLLLAAGAAVLTNASRVAWAESYPTRPVRIVVGFPPGTATDIVARLLAKSLSEKLGEQFFVENETGAATNIGTEAVIRSAPDGYTLLAMTVTNAVNETLYKNLDFDFASDIEPIASTIRSANVMEVTLSVPAKTVPEFIAYAKANPGKLYFASEGYGTAPDMAAELFKMMTGIHITQVPYRGNYMADLISGRVQVAFSPIPLTIANIRAGKLRALAVTSATPSAALPGIPTVAEFVPGYEADIWHGIGAPKGTPTMIVDKLHRTINGILGEPATKAELANLGAEPMPMTRQEFGHFVAAQIVKWARVVKFADIKVS